MKAELSVKRTRRLSNAKAPLLVHLGAVLAKLGELLCTRLGMNASLLRPVPNLRARHWCTEPIYRGVPFEH